MGGLNSLVRERGMLMAPYYEAALNILGVTGTIIPLGDYRHGQPNATTLTSVGAEQTTWTWSEAPNAFATPLDLTSEDNWQGIIPVISLNGTDEDIDTPDITYYSRGDSSNDNVMSVGMWINKTAAAGDYLFDKWGSVNDKEWALRIDGSNLLRLDLYDESLDLSPYRISDAAILTVEQWVFVVATYTGAGGSSAAAGIVLYANGAAVASTANEQGSYVAMENGNSLPTLFSRGDGAAFYGGKVAGGAMGPFFAQVTLTADQVKRLYNLGRAAMGL